MEQYDELRMIGKGSFGSVFLVRRRADRRELVMKKMSIGNVSSKEREAYEMEAKLLNQLEHPGIVEFVQSFVDKKTMTLCIVMDYCDGGDLTTFLKRRQNTLMTENEILDYFAQMALALAYMHDRNVLHRDLKTQNIFLKDGMIKLGDFGISKMLNSSVDFARTCIGTPYYMSPEQYLHQQYNYKSDVWSLGCVLYELATLKHAFDAHSLNSLASKITKGSYLPISSKYSKNLATLIKTMLAKQPAARPSLFEILQKPFIRKHVKSLAAHVMANRTSYRDTHVNNLKKQLVALGMGEFLQKSEANPDPKATMQVEKEMKWYEQNKKLQEEEEANDRLEKALKQLQSEHERRKAKLRQQAGGAASKAASPSVSPAMAPLAIAGRPLSANPNAMNRKLEDAAKRKEQLARAKEKDILEKAARQAQRQAAAAQRRVKEPTPRKPAAVKSNKSEAEEKRRVKDLEDWDDQRASRQEAQQQVNNQQLQQQQLALLHLHRLQQQQRVAQTPAPAPAPAPIVSQPVQRPIVQTNAPSTQQSPQTQPQSSQAQPKVVETIVQPTAAVRVIQKEQPKPAAAAVNEPERDREFEDLRKNREQLQKDIESIQSEVQAMRIGTGAERAARRRFQAVAQPTPIAPTPAPAAQIHVVPEEADSETEDVADIAPTHIPQQQPQLLLPTPPARPPPVTVQPSPKSGIVRSPSDVGMLSPSKAQIQLQQQQQQSLSPHTQAPTQQDKAQRGTPALGNSPSPLNLSPTSLPTLSPSQRNGTDSSVSPSQKAPQLNATKKLPSIFQQNNWGQSDDNEDIPVPAPRELVRSQSDYTSIKSSYATPQPAPLSLSPNSAERQRLLIETKERQKEKDLALLRQHMAERNNNAYLLPGQAGADGNRLSPGRRTAAGLAPPTLPPLQAVSDSEVSTAHIRKPHHAGQQPQSHGLSAVRRSISMDAISSNAHHHGRHVPRPPPSVTKPVGAHMPAQAYAYDDSDTVLDSTRPKAELAWQAPVIHAIDEHDEDNATRAPAPAKADTANDNEDVDEAELEAEESRLRALEEHVLKHTMHVEELRRSLLITKAQLEEEKAQLVQDESSENSGGSISEESETDDETDIAEETEDATDEEDEVDEEDEDGNDGGDSDLSTINGNLAVRIMSMKKELVDILGQIKFDEAYTYVKRMQSHPDFTADSEENDALFSEGITGILGSRKKLWKKIDHILFLEANYYG